VPVDHDEIPVSAALLTQIYPLWANQEQKGGKINLCFVNRTNKASDSVKGLAGRRAAPVYRRRTAAGTLENRALSQFARVMVLVVDDNHYMRVIVSTMLRSMGITLIREASDGAEALEIVRDWRPDVIILDLMMETIDGIEFTKLIRRGVDSPHPYVPIIMMTGHTDRRRVIEARDAGVNEFVAKPLTARALIDRLKSVINNERGWVKSANYVGPDRRRRVHPDFKGPFRRIADKADGKM
jgi:CheY-like chemotaxis protein